MYAQYVGRVKLDDDQRVRALRMILGISGTMTVQQMAEDLAALPPGSGAEDRCDALPESRNCGRISIVRRQRDVSLSQFLSRCASIDSWQEADSSGYR